MKIHPIITQNALNNIFYIIEFGIKRALVIDPCDTKMTQDFLEKHDLQVEKIFITHEHFDHYEGVLGLNCSEIYAGKIASENIPFDIKNIFSDGEVFFDCDEFCLQALASPGHAAGHVMFELHKKSTLGSAGMCPDFVSAIFSGDVLFQGGVGHTRNGSSTDLYNSVKLFENYNADVVIYPAHDYLDGNIEFAKKYAPHKLEALLKIQKLSKEKVMFTKLFQERSINPFVGVSKKEFIRLRELKNNF